MPVYGVQQFYLPHPPPPLAPEDLPSPRKLHSFMAANSHVPGEVNSSVCSPSSPCEKLSLKDHDPLSHQAPGPPASEGQARQVKGAGGVHEGLGGNERGQASVEREQQRLGGQCECQGAKKEGEKQRSGGERGEGEGQEGRKKQHCSLGARRGTKEGNTVIMT
ncbi:uncharacterized protein VSU04_008020 isoform 1-T3 [Chlamydotis macqueenii]